MKDIVKLHEEVFNYLSEWSEKARTNNEINPYFYMRSVEDDRLKRGYWFPGDDHSVYISFWTGGDSLNKTPNIFFEINENTGCRVFIVAKDSESKFKYFVGMVGEIYYRIKSRDQYIRDYNIWIKEFSGEWKFWEELLLTFITVDKEVIDNYIILNEFKLNEEFISKFGFIAPSEFDVMYSRVLKERDLLKINRNNNLNVLNNRLPFALLGINIENFQGVKHSSINDLKPDARWIFITGENGYGKTTILQAIALGASSDPELEKYLDEKTRVSLELISRNEKAFPVRTKGTVNQNISYDYGQFVVGYGPARLNVQSKSSENMESRSQNHVLSLFDNEILLKNINHELFAANFVDDRAFKDLEEIIKTVTNGRISKIEVKGREVLFEETLSNGEVLDGLPLNKIAAGFRSIINIVFDIYLRLKRVHKNLRYDDFYGIVLIDELENHLHPILQRELPTTLSKVFPMIQFIISTHSPIPLLAADKNSIILKVNRTKDEGVTIEKIEIDNVVELTPNILFTSPVFGFSDIINQNLTSDSNLRTEKSWEEMKKTDTLDKELMALYNQRKGKK